MNKRNHIKRMIRFKCKPNVLIFYLFIMHDVLNQEVQSFIITILGILFLLTYSKSFLLKSIIIELIIIHLTHVLKFGYDFTILIDNQFYFKKS